VPRPAPAGGAHQLSAVRHFRLLDLAVSIRTSDQAVAREIEFLAQDARQPKRPARTVTYDVEPASDGWYSIAEDGVALDSEPYTWGVVDNLFRRVHRRAFATLAGGALVRAATGSLGRRRFAIVGPSGGGLTCLAVRLLHRGAAMESDQLAVVRDGEVTGFPRPFYLYAGAREVLPEIAGRFDTLPCLEAQHGYRIWAYHPDSDGFDWSVTTGPVDVLVGLEPEHGADTELAEIPHYEMARMLTSCWCDVGDGSPAPLGELAGLAAGAECLKLRVGSLDAAVVAFREALC
jgi:hypothetical protein